MTEIKIDVAGECAMSLYGTVYHFYRTLDPEAKGNPICGAKLVHEPDLKAFKEGHFYVIEDLKCAKCLKRIETLREKKYNEEYDKLKAILTKAVKDLQESLDTTFHICIWTLDVDRLGRLTNVLAKHFKLELYETLLDAGLHDDLNALAIKAGKKKTDIITISV